ncbi:anti-anti-sigma factor [Leptospira perolatii]|uniref:Anti-anti-sigma factor n=1 Tax=Leptospira perolatii TaxID=2023191 RepID=A0A2M9ZPC4_9LEPT|nr:STAS domain-containing protein [Leptospira perolatii]PJZ70719.1 anti-anti-sigma factor [Leptospira perolatii]PJZ73928.1 anti-anti-sigma factor [Leptospira perolatii]
MDSLRIIKQEAGRDITVYLLSGRLDESTFPSFKETILDATHTANTVMNLSELKYVSSSGIRAVFELKNRLSHEGKKLILTEAGEKVIQIFNLLGLWKPFTHFEKEEDAIASCLR